MPGIAERPAQPHHVVVDVTEVLGDHVERAQLGLDRLEDRGAWTLDPASVQRGLVAVAGTSQNAEKPRKWSTRTRSNSSKVRRKRSIHQR